MCENRGSEPDSMHILLSEGVLAAGALATPSSKVFLDARSAEDVEASCDDDVLRTIGANGTTHEVAIVFKLLIAPRAARITATAASEIKAPSHCCRRSEEHTSELQSLMRN